MTREIKFNYLWKDNDGEIHNEDTTFTIEQIEDGESYDYLDCCGSITWKPIRRAYTGLKDKNGKEIYEGDVVEGGGCGGGDYVFYCNESKEFHIGNNALSKDLDNPYCYCCGGEYDMNEFREELNKIEIIGNIYENPELLSKDKCETF